jgi:hypothetical protein
MEMTDHIKQMLDYYGDRSIVLTMIMQYWEEGRIEEYMPFAREELENIEKKYKKGRLFKK